MPWNFHSLGTGAGLLGHHHCVLADSLPFCFAGHSGMILKWGCRYTSLLNFCVVCNGMEYIRHGVILQRASKSNIATRWAMKDSKKPMSWLAGGPCICFVSAIFGHVGVSLSQISFNFLCLTERGSVFCSTHYSIRSELLAWQCRGRNRNSWDSSCACVGVCVQPLRYVDSVCMVLNFPSQWDLRWGSRLRPLHNQLFFLLGTTLLQ